MSAESDHDEKIEASQDDMVAAIYAHSMTIVEKELESYTAWLFEQGVLKHRGAMEFDPAINAQRYMQETWS